MDNATLYQLITALKTLSQNQAAISKLRKVCLNVSAAANLRNCSGINCLINPWKFIQESEDGCCRGININDKNCSGEDLLSIWVPAPSSSPGQMVPRTTPVSECSIPGIPQLIREFLCSDFDTHRPALWILLLVFAVIGSVGHVSLLRLTCRIHRRYKWGNLFLMHFGLCNAVDSLIVLPLLLYVMWRCPVTCSVQCTLVSATFLSINVTEMMSLASFTLLYIIFVTIPNLFKQKTFTILSIILLLIPWPLVIVWIALTIESNVEVACYPYNSLYRESPVLIYATICVTLSSSLLLLFVQSSSLNQKFDSYLTFGHGSDFVTESQHVCRRNKRTRFILWQRTNCTHCYLRNQINKYFTWILSYKYPSPTFVHPSPYFLLSLLLVLSAGSLPQFMLSYNSLERITPILSYLALIWQLGIRTLISFYVAVKIYSWRKQN